MEEITYDNWQFEEAEISYNTEKRTNVTGEDIIATVTYDEVTIAVAYKVTPASVKEAKVSADNQIYTGIALTPEVVVTLGDKTLVKDTDYEVAYTDNTDIGTATVTVKGIGNYTDEATGRFEVEYLKDTPDAIVSGIEGSNGWYTSDVMLTPPEGYEIAQIFDGTFSDSPMTVSGEQNETVTYYLKNAEGQIAEKQIELKIDLNDPTAEYQIGTNGWKKFVNTISFGLFCKDYKKVEINYADSESGVAVKQYYIANAEMNTENLESIQWKDYEETLSLEATGTYFVYIRMVDNAGHEVILNSEGIVIYADSEADTESVTLNFKEGTDTDVSVKLNGNTVKAVKNGEQVLSQDTDYSINGHRITLKADYLNTLKAGTYTITVSYHPQGVETDEVNVETTFTLVVEKATINDVKAPVAVAGLIYNGEAQELITAGTTQKGEIQYSLDGAIYFKELPTATNAGDYTVYYKVAGGENYKDVDAQTVVATIGKKELTPSVAGSATKSYDGTESIPEDNSLRIDLDGIIPSDDVTANAEYTYVGADAGTTTVKAVNITLTGTDSENYELAKNEASAEVGEITKTTPELGEVTAMIPDNTTDSSEVVLERTNGTVVGVLKVADEDQILVWGENTVAYTFTPEDTTNYEVVTGEVTVVVTDTIAPTGTVSVGENVFKEFLNAITFGLFFNKTVDVEATAEDVLSGVKEIAYVELSEALELSEVDALADELWTVMNDKVSVTPEDAKQFVYYIRITDNADNVTYLSTDGAEFDTQKPVITGIKDGDIFFVTTTFDAADTNFEQVTVNGASVTEYVLAGNTDITYTITAIDKAGNSSTVIVTMKPLSEITADIDALTEETVTADDAAKMEAVKDALAAVDTTNAKPEEKAAIKAAQDKIDTLQNVIKATADEVKAMEDAVASYDKESVKSTDETAVNQLVADLTAKMEDANLTVEQKSALETALAEAKALVQQIEDNKTALEEANNSVPTVDTDKVTADNTEELEAAKDKLEDIINNDNYTEEEQQAAQEHLDRIEELEKVIEETEKEKEKIGKKD